MNIINEDDSRQDAKLKLAFKIPACKEIERYSKPRPSENWLRTAKNDNLHVIVVNVMLKHVCWSRCYPIGTSKVNFE